MAGCDTLNPTPEDRVAAALLAVGLPFLRHRALPIITRAMVLYAVRNKLGRDVADSTRMRPKCGLQNLGYR